MIRNICGALLLLCSSAACPIGTCPSGYEDFGPAVSNQCPSGTILVSGVCCMKQQIASPAPTASKCPDGWTFVRAAANGKCEPGTTKFYDSCCMSSFNPGPFPILSAAPDCPIGYQAYGSMTNGVCSTENINGRCCLYIRGPCTQVPAATRGLCPIGYESLGPALANSECAPKARKYNGDCCQWRGCDETHTITCGENDIYARGGCYATLPGGCGPGYACSRGSFCCPAVNVEDRRELFGPTNSTGGCPEDTAVVYGLSYDTTYQGYCFYF